MIFELNKNLRLIGGDYVLRDENLISFCGIDFIKDGLVLTNEQGQLVAQLIMNKGNVTISIADGPSVTVNSKYEIRKPALSEEEHSFITDKAQSREEMGEYFYFGNPSSFRYELYVKEKSGKPVLGAEIIPNPWKEDYFKVRIGDNVNQLKMLALCLAFTLISTKGGK